jgi:hypothetical protein
MKGCIWRRIGTGGGERDARIRRNRTGRNGIDDGWRARLVRAVFLKSQAEILNAELDATSQRIAELEKEEQLRPRPGRIGASDGAATLVSRPEILTG